MDATEELDPAVASILDAAERRELPKSERVTVQARSVVRAISAAEAVNHVPVIAEIKPTSPTTNGRRNDDPVELALEMVEAGAAALSVLTEPDHFGGSPDALVAVRDAVDVPILRKDFIVSNAQLDVVEADIVLLIARFVDDLDMMLAAARERGFQVLVEVHTDRELERAIDSGATIIGINNRDLASLTVDLNTFERLAPSVPDHVTLVAESGMATPADVRRMRAAGADAVLIGSAIMAGDIYARTRRFVEAEQ